MPPVQIFGMRAVQKPTFKQMGIQDLNRDKKKTTKGSITSNISSTSIQRDPQMQARITDKCVNVSGKHLWLIMRWYTLIATFGLLATSQAPIT